MRHWTREHPRETADGHGDSAATPWIACDDVEFPRRPGPRTAWAGASTRAGMTELLLRLRRERPDLDLMITENGAAFPDVVGADGMVHDDDRVEYLRGHLAAVHAAIAAGAGSGLLRVVAAGQLRVGVGLRQALRDRARRLRDAGAHAKDSARFYAQVVAGQRRPVDRRPEHTPSALSHSTHDAAPRTAGAAARREVRRHGRGATATGSRRPRTAAAAGPGRSAAR